MISGCGVEVGEMATIFDYLVWRADVPFSVDPFNEVDNLILAELSYTDFGGIVPENDTKISISDAYREFFARHTREEIAANKSFTAKAPLLMDEMVKGRRFGNMTLRNYIDVSGENLQLSAVTFGLDDRTDYAAFRGTDGTVAGWKEDFNFSFMNETEGQKLAVQYLNGTRGMLRVGGHSKGGNLAVYAAAFCDTQDRILEVYSNDGPGFRDEIISREGFQRILPRVKNIVPDSSVIGLLLSGYQSRHVVKSSASGITQHDGFTWQVIRNRFEDATLSDVSKLIDQAIGKWLSSMDDAARQSFTEIVFSLIESTGKERFSSMSEDKWKTAESILNAVKNLPKEQQQEGIRLLSQLGQSGGQTILEYLTGLLNGRP